MECEINWQSWVSSTNRFYDDTDRVLQVSNDLSVYATPLPPRKKKIVV